jgi:hypothetical protein
MAMLLYILIIVGAVVVIASGIWVAVTLLKVVSTKQPASRGEGGKT